MGKNIIILGLTSLFTDISSEMIYPLIPLYLTSVLGASPAILGLIEGIAESLASILKIFSGRISDKLKKRKIITIIGYSLSAVSKILFVIATSWAGILGARVSDRFGKGIRTAPRDALIAESCKAEDRGKSFGLHRAMDTLGAVIGIFLAYFLFTHYKGKYINVFWISIVPAIIGVLLLFLLKEKNDFSEDNTKLIQFSWRTLDSRLKYYIIICFLFNLGNSSNQFLLLKASNYGFHPQTVILLYLLMNITYLLISYPAGCLSDYIGRRTVLVVGYFIYGLVYLGFSVANNGFEFIILFGIYGIYTGLTDGIEKAFLADMSPKEQRATVYGLHTMAVGIALMPASIIAGLLWNIFGAKAPFLFGGIMGILAAIAVWFGLKSTNIQVES